jgi:hypothetical protein
MLVADLMKKIYKRFEKSSDDPDNTSEDYIVRLEYVNAEIEKWENEIGIEWKELFGTLSQTLVNGVYNNNTGVGTLENFKRPAGFLRIGEDKYEYVRPEQVEKEQRENPNKKIYTVTGSKGTYSINVYPAVSGAFTLDYRKLATTYSTGTETTEIEMSDPSFIIHGVLSQLYQDDNNNSQAGVEMQISNEKMSAMKTANEVVPWYNNNEVPSDNISFGT